MLTKLIDTSTCTPIAQLPNILNRNNRAIEEEFAEIYDSEDNCLKKSLNAPVGSVKAYNGEFTTVSLENLVLRNPNALQDVVKNTIKTIPHNLVTDRYSSAEVDSAMSVNMAQEDYHFCHDASTIVLPNFSTTVKGVLEDIETSRYFTVYTVMESMVKQMGLLQQTIYTNAQSQSTSGIMTLALPGEETNVLTSTKKSLKAKANTAAEQSSETTEYNGKEPFAYPASYTFATPVQLKRLNVPQLHMNDLLNGNRYTYYNISIPNITITNNNVNALECTKAGIIVNIAFNATDTSKKGIFEILLDRNNNKRIIIETGKPEVTRLQLICIEPYSDSGTVWDLYNYSMPSTQTSNIDIITE